MSHLQISQREARTALRALSEGTPPPPTVARELTFGRESLYAWFEERLGEAKIGYFSSPVLVGDPGSGKTHALNLMKLMAIEGNFAVSQFAQDSSTHGTLNRPDRIYAAILESLEIPPLGALVGDPLKHVLLAWARQVSNQIDARIKSARYFGLACEADLMGGLSFEDVPPRTRLCLLGVLLGVRLDDSELIEFSISSLRKRTPENREVLRCIAQREPEFSMYTGYTPTSYDIKFYLAQLRTLTHIMLQVGYSGLVILSDEATGIANLPVRSRHKAYRDISSIVRNTAGLDYCIFLMAFMPAFLVTLQSDARNYAEEVFSWVDDWEAAIVNLEELNEEELALLAEAILTLRAIAGESNEFDSDDIRTMAAEHGGSLREWVRFWVGQRDEVTTTA